MSSDHRRTFLQAACFGGSTLGAFAQTPPSQAATAGLASINVRERGAVGDGSQMDTRAIQNALDECARNGGGTVLVPNGVYLTSTLILRNNVTLHLAPGAKLLGSPNIGDYLDRQAVGGSAEFRKSMLYAGKAQRIAVTGTGTIDGQGALFDRTKERTRLIYFEDCRNVNIFDVTLQNAAEWVSHYMRCDDMTIRGVKIDSFANYNNDGLDIDGCQNVCVTGCHIVCSDDAICLKSEMARPCKNITISNCVIRSRWGAIKFGTPGFGGFENIAITNCALYDTWGCAIKLELVDGGSLRNVTIDNIAMDNVTGPFFIRLGNRGSVHHTGAPKQPPGILRDVIISNVQATLATTFRRSIDGSGNPVSPPFARIGSYITGLPGHPVDGIVFDNIRIICPGGGTREEAWREVPELENEYPEYDRFGPSPAYGFYIRHARNISLRNISLETRIPDLRPAVAFVDVEDFEVAGLRAQAVADGEAVVSLRDARSGLIRDSRVAGSAKSLVHLRGASQNIGLIANDLRRAARASLFDDGIPESAVREQGQLYRE